MTHSKRWAALLLAFAMCAGAMADETDIRRTPVVVAVEKVRGAVVNISTERVVVRRASDPFFGPGDDFFDRLFEDFFGPMGRGPVVERRTVQQPLGSGCIITPDGLVVTNEHVVRRASNIILSLATGESFEGELLAADPDEDLALLRAKSSHPLDALKMGTSSDIMLGETVIALGNPFGFENSVTTGVVSALKRSLTVGGDPEGVHYEELIQTSALINPGNSGGPLVNVLGELIGINAAVVDQAQGIGFAIPIDRVRDKLAPLLAARKVSEAWSGLSGEATANRSGALVTAVHAQSPANDRVRPGDIIVEVNGRRVRDFFDVALAVAQSRPGDVLSLRVNRGGDLRNVEIRLARMPEIPGNQVLARRFGISGRDLTPALARQLGLWVGAGVLITDITENGPAERAGLRRGDVIVQIGAHTVRNQQDAADALAEAKPGERILIVVVRGPYRGYTRLIVPTDAI